MLAAWIPDIDNVVGGGPEFYLLYHRAITRSLFGGFCLVLVLATVSWTLSRRKWAFGPLLAFSYGCVLPHIFLEWINNYGTRILAPFSDLRFQSLHPWAKRIQPEDEPSPFSLEVRLDAAGNISDWRYDGPTFGGFED